MSRKSCLRGNGIPWGLVFIGGGVLIGGMHRGWAFIGRVFIGVDSS